MIRPELRDSLIRLQEVWLCLIVAAFGGWLVYLGGYLLMPLGLVVIVGACAMAVLAWRRLRFVQPVSAPGMVELDEGQISYFGPQIGGSISLSDLVELRIISLRGRRLWRLKQADGQAILIPIEAEGAAQLFDAFCSLPGLSSSDLLEALDPKEKPNRPAMGALRLGDEDRLVWHRKGKGVVVQMHGMQ